MPLDVAPIYCAEQIEVPEALPDILKEWSKSVLRANLESRDQLFAFSAEYFRNLSAQTGGGDDDFANIEDKVPYLREAFRMMQDAFYSIDTDMSGSIEKTELMTMWRQLGVELDDETLSSMFSEADVDQSGKITLAEFLSSTCMWISANEAAEAFAGISALRNSFEHVYRAFSLFDTAAAGVAKKEDLCAVLAEIGLTLLPNQVSQIFLTFISDFEEKADVTFKEFLIGLFLHLTKDPEPEAAP